MRAVEVANVTFGYGANQLFQEVGFALEDGQRAALVAPNGAGKSTLLRLIAGELRPDSGSLVVRKGAKVAYFRQSHEVAASGTVREAFLSGFRELLSLRAELERAQHDAASGTAQALDTLSRAHDRYQIAGGDDVERRVDVIAQHLGFGARDLDRSVTSLSGGERGRLSLGSVLAQEADLLLLDEPTNHLDLETISWLEQHLRGLSSAMLVVSHDRAFMDAVCSHTLELGRRSFRSYPLSWSAYEAAREEDLERERALAERHDAFVAKTEDFIRRNIAGQKTKQAQSRRKMLDKLDGVDRPEDVWDRAEKVRFRFAEVPRSGDVVLEANGLGASRGGRALFEGLDLLVKRGERLAIVGRNGAGKSTLLKMLAGVSDPGDAGTDAGTVRRGTNLRDGYFDQHLGALDPGRSAVEEVRSVRGDFTVDAAREYLARFRFGGDEPLRRVSSFSGGERSRLALAKMLLEPRNLLFLDEPTNHLDIPAARILEEALSSFEGTVVLVSHDRSFLSAISTRVVYVHGDLAQRTQSGLGSALRGVDVYPGGFRDWLEQRSRPSPPADEEEVAPSRGERKVKRTASTAPPAPIDDAAARKRSFEADRLAKRARERKEKRVKELEELIERGEADLATMREALRGDPGGDWAKLAARANEEQALTKRVEEWMTEWSSLSDELAGAP
jgi:ATP-binding cassette subfamily F protein 3